MKKVFLGGTCNNSTWREDLIPKLTINYFNPVVKDWTPECQAIEEAEKAIADTVLYVITPLMTGVFSIAEVVDDSNKRPTETVFAVLNKDGESAFTKHQYKSLLATSKLLTKNGATVIIGDTLSSQEILDRVATHLNGN